MDRDGIKILLELAGDRFPRLSHLWLDAGYNGQGQGCRWVEKVLCGLDGADRAVPTEAGWHRRR
jgi:hypothetical protein